MALIRAAVVFAVEVIKAASESNMMFESQRFEHMDLEGKYLQGNEGGGGGGWVYLCQGVRDNMRGFMYFIIIKERLLWKMV